MHMTIDLKAAAKQATARADHCEDAYRSRFGTPDHEMVGDDTLDQIRAGAYRLHRAARDVDALRAAAQEAQAEVDHFAAGFRLYHGLDADEPIEDATLNGLMVEAAMFQHALAEYA